MKTVKILAAGAAILLLFGAYKYSRAGYESPDYKVLRNDGPFEVREYASMMVATTRMDNAEPDQDGGFMRLFRYISGANESNQKIAMTTPVFLRGEGEGRTMSFVVPKSVAEQGAPEATSGEIRIETVPGGTFATYRFSGSWDVNKFDEATAKLMSRVEENGLKPVGNPQIANYDPPFTPPFLRRNEILVRLEGE